MDTTARHIRTPLPGYIMLALLPPVLFVGRFCLVVIGFMTWSVPIFELGELVWDTGALLTFVGLPIAMCALRSRRAADHQLAISIALMGNIVLVPPAALSLRHLVEQWLLYGPSWPV